MPAKSIVSLTFVLALTAVILADDRPSSSSSPDALRDAKQSRAPSIIEQLREAAQRLEAVANVEKGSQHDNRTRSDDPDELSLQIAAIQKQLDQISELTGRREQTLFEVRVLEVPVHVALALAEPGSEAAPGSGPTRNVFKNTQQLNKKLATVEGVKEVGDPQIIMSPGRPANLVSGGEFPIPKPVADNATAIEWCAFGTRCELVYHPLDAGRIRLEISAEISQRDMTSAISVDGQLIPGIQSRRVNTQVDMNFGETLMVGVPTMSRRMKPILGVESEIAMCTLFLLTPTPVRAVK